MSGLIRVAFGGNRWTLIRSANGELSMSRPLARLLTTASRRNKFDFGKYEAGSNKRVNANMNINSRWTQNRRCSSKSSPAKKPEGAETTEVSTITFQQGARAATQGGLFIGIGAAVIFFGSLIISELMPTKMSPNSVFNTVFERIKDHPEVVSRVGENIKGYGRDRNTHKEGRRNFIDHDKFTDLDGVKHIRVKFHVEGSRGRANVYAEVSQDMEPGEFAYIIIEQIIRGQSNAVALIDNRREMSKEELQQKLSQKLASLNAVLYGHSNCQWTQRQIIEFGDFAKNLKVLMCDKPDAKEECEKAGLQGYPMWTINGEPLPGYQPLEQLQNIVTHM
mmetsp:Transcript_7780/g.9267  ORF Transcript_7780/g.9267 Transcript_7780/m.9267 type:complete len:335 (+) Transcript_7780:352-1356(+)|eukprot:CAMPEP_0204826928 /NCGR_PEP_ID=MMETSP1346-20131115/4522_1 /ASSEMBLY_ACC=CAM_ASM_000771 /TAXON_ID=215587 /ORGANISM="Aplanochytrium stocchinoi, Strain GSBS06" /LENGTH=334 /DNA_ID=CAMNT_0051955167 /DNA_START=267 /DNA_END=1271 /DNA_ORIENTATION=+